MESLKVLKRPVVQSMTGLIFICAGDTTLWMSATFTMKELIILSYSLSVTYSDRT